MVAIKKYLPSIHQKFGTDIHLLHNRSYPLALIQEEQRLTRPTFIRERSTSNSSTPRGYIATVLGIFPCAILYYVDILLANNPSLIMDVGCGDNLFKDIIPGIYGVDPKAANADSLDGNFNAEYAENHAQEFECAMAVCCIHFISLTQFKNQIELFAKIIKPGGRGLIGFNTMMMVERTPDSELETLFGSTQPTDLQVEEYVDQELKKINLNFLVVENIVREIPDENIDGNVRLVFEV